MKSNIFKKNKIKYINDNWQEKNKNWWENNPMRYDWTNKINPAEFSKEFYQEIDNRFFTLSEEYMPYKQIPFDPLIPYESLREKDVLEIGVGNGSHAQLLAQNSKTFTGIDLTEYAVNSTKNRFNLFSYNYDKTL